VSERARLFVALDLPPGAREALVGWRDRALASIPGLRPVALQALHVTLCFLGWRLADEVQAIGEECLRASRSFSPTELTFDRATWLPARRPHVLAVRLDDGTGTLARLHASLSAALSGGGWYAPEPRPFLAHVTVARVTRGVRVRASELEAVPRLEFTAAEVTLYRSHLGSGGARYEALRTIPLGSADTSTIDPVAVVRAFHVEQASAYAGGDVQALRTWLADDVVWHVPGRSQIAGEHRGVEGVLAYFETRRRLTGESFRVEVHGLSAIGDRVVQLAGGSAVRDGHAVEWETVGVFRVADGRIAECWLVPFDLFEFDEIWA